MSKLWEVVEGASKATRDYAVAVSFAADGYSAADVASLYDVPVEDVPGIKEPAIVPVKNLVRWNNARLDGKNI